MGVLTLVAHVIYIGAGVLMVFAILLQEGKGGGLSALGGTQAESAFGATNPVRRMTVVLAVIFFLLAGFLSYMGSRKRVRFGEEATPAAGAPVESRGESAPAEASDESQPSGAEESGAAAEAEPGGAPGEDAAAAPEGEGAAPAAAEPESQPKPREAPEAPQTRE